MPGDAPLQTALHGWHQAHGGRMVEFAGWSMPVQYTSIIEEHRAVRQGVGLFDISHMGRLTVHGPAAREWLERITTNHVERLGEGQIQYSLMVNEAGGILDDVLVYRHPEPMGYVMVCNASNRAKVVAQFEINRPEDEAVFADRTTATAMIAVQGPKALETLQPLFSAPLDGLKYYHSTMGRVTGAEAVVSRTGYTGEDGFELMVGANRAQAVWEALLDAGKTFGVVPCGLGARDTLRFEAAMPLYGHEMDETVNPYEAGLGWAVKLDKGDFIGREVLKQLKEKPGQTRIGLALEGKRIARQGCAVKLEDEPIGTVTSGTFSPTLNQSLAMALVEPRAAAEGTRLTVEVRGNDEPAKVVPLPFYKRPTAHA